MDTDDDVLKIKSNSSYSREDRLVLLNMYEKSNKNNELAEFLKHRNK